MIRYEYQNGRPTSHSSRELLAAAKTELEIVPDPVPREHYRYQANKRWGFLVRFRGDPVVGAAVLLTTEHGSRLEGSTDSEGRVSFVLPDDFPEVHPGRDANAPAEMTLYVDRGAAPKRYRTRLNAAYHADPGHWRSLPWGVGVVALGLLAGLAGTLRSRNGNGGEMTVNLSLTRKVVQLAAFVFLVYGSVVTGYFLADKLGNAFPALSCAYDMQNADYCALIPIQHQMAHRVGESITQGTSLAMGLLPVGITLATFLLLFVLLKKAFCGWICPLGLFQDLLTMVGQKLGLPSWESLSDRTVDRLRPVKWLMLAVLVFGLPLLSGLGFVSHDLVGAFCAVCPSRILTTLATGSTDQLYVDNANGTLMFMSVAGDLLFGAVVGLGLTMRQPFCRICPMLALHAVFRKLGLVRLVKNASPRCDRCGLCAKSCPMDIREVHTEVEKKNITFPDCTLCGRCVEFCPDKDVLQLKYTVFPVFSASPQYFKARKRAQKRWESWSLSRLFSKEHTAETEKT